MPAEDGAEAEAVQEAVQEADELQALHGADELLPPATGASRVLRGTGVSQGRRR